MKLITETIEQDVEIITEAATGDAKKSYFIEGIFMQADLKNRNGRVYPGSILENEMKRYNKDFIQTKRALGELGHPNGPQINADRVSHVITEMKRDGNNFYGKAKILSTPFGNIVKNFIDEGVKIGVSTRGLGSVKQTNEGIMEVQNDFHLATVDIVTDPSGPNCFVNGILENTEYFFDIATSSWLTADPSKIQTEDYKSLYETAMIKLEKLEALIKEMKKAPKKPVISEDKALSVFETYLGTLK